MKESEFNKLMMEATEGKEWVNLQFSLENLRCLVALMQWAHVTGKALAELETMKGFISASEKTMINSENASILLENILKQVAIGEPDPEQVH